MSNFGFISKKKVAKEIAKRRNEHSGMWANKEQCYFDAGVCSVLNALCADLNIKPIHLNSLAGGTGEMYRMLLLGHGTADITRRWKNDKGRSDQLDYKYHGRHRQG